MNDFLTDAAKTKRQLRKMVDEGKIIGCPICYEYINNNNEDLKKHLLGHSIDDIVDDFIECYRALEDPYL